MWGIVLAVVYTFYFIYSNNRFDAAKDEPVPDDGKLVEDPGKVHMPSAPFTAKAAHYNFKRCIVYCLTFDAFYT